jgi:hypothetical protein
MVFDPMKQKEINCKFMIAFDNMVEERLGPNPGIRLKSYHEFDRVIGKRAGFTQQESEQIALDVSKDGLIGMGGNSLNEGRLYYLEEAGRDFARQEKYEKTIKAKVRKLKRGAVESGKQLLNSVWSNLLTGGGGLIAGWLLGYNLQWTPLSRPKIGDPSLLPLQALMALASR